MDIDARFVKDIEIGVRLNTVQLVAHIGLADACHYYYRAVVTNDWSMMHPDTAHKASHVAFGCFSYEFPEGIVRDMLDQVYCRAFMQACAYLLLLKNNGDDAAIALSSKILKEGMLELHFVGLESTASQGFSIVRLFDDEGGEPKSNGKAI